MLLTEFLPKFPQYEDIPYAGDFNCPNCDKTGFFDGFGEEKYKELKSKLQDLIFKENE